VSRGLGEESQDGTAVQHGFRRVAPTWAPGNASPSEDMTEPESALQLGQTTRVEVCAMVRNEGRFLVEWVEYHLMIGVHHITLYLHLTSDE
jgi:hypothetical protein